MNTVVFPEDIANAVKSAYLLTEEEESRNLLLSVGSYLIDISSDEMFKMIR